MTVFVRPHFFLFIVSNGMYITPTGYATDSFVSSDQRRQLWQGQTKDSSRKDASTITKGISKARMVHQPERELDSEVSPHRRNLLYTGAPPWYAFPPVYPSRTDGGSSTYSGGYSSGSAGGGSSSWGASHPPPPPIPAPAPAPAPEPHHHDTSSYAESHPEGPRSHGDDETGEVCAFV